MMLNKGESDPFGKIKTKLLKKSFQATPQWPHPTGNFPSMHYYYIFGEVNFTLKAKIFINFPDMLVTKAPELVANSGFFHDAGRFSLLTSFSEYLLFGHNKFNG